MDSTPSYHNLKANQIPVTDSEIQPRLPSSTAFHRLTDKTNSREPYVPTTMDPLKLSRLAALASILSATGTATCPAKDKDKAAPIRIEHQIHQIEGWNVHVDASLLAGEHKETGDLALRIMGERLHQIALRLPAGPVAKMREVPIYLDRNHPLGNAHYHPSADWLEKYGYDPAMAKAVHITGAASLVREARSPNSGSVLLHELAHAYHERVLGFDHAGILAGYKLFCDSRKFEKTDHVSGRNQPHYGLTDHKEYFAEMTETFFVGNGYFPFNHYQLHREHPESYALIATIWGSEIKPPVADDKGAPSILDLRIQANLLSQRGDYDAALNLVEEAQKRDSDSEGRLAGLKKEIEEQRAKAPGGESRR